MEVNCLDHKKAKEGGTERKKAKEGGTERNKAKEGGTERKICNTRETK